MMGSDAYSIGELSRLSGIPLRRIRFYSDKGLLPPKSRTRGGYRIYSSADLARLRTISALREAQVSLAVIRKTLSRQLSFAEVMRVQLRALEAEIASRGRVAAALRAALGMSAITETDFGRLWIVLTLSREQLRRNVESFVEAVTEGFEVNDAWKAQMVKQSMPELPQDPTSEQIDAWLAITDMFKNKDVLFEMRREMRLIWKGDADLASYAEASRQSLTAAREAVRDGLLPTSAAASTIARRWLEAVAGVMRCSPDRAFNQWARRHCTHSLRLHKLLAVVRSDDEGISSARAAIWLNEAVRTLQSA